MGLCLPYGKHRQTIIGFSLFFVLLLFYSTLHASQVTLAWDPSDSDVDGYNLYMRAEGQAYDYTSPVWSGVSTTCTIDQLEDNTYYFVARSYAASNESIDSNEVEYKVVVNSAPQSDAGTDQAVSAGTQVTIDGSGSTDSDGSIAGYKWTQTSGPSVSLSSSTSSQVTFTAPSVTESTALSFQLAVTDNGGLTNSDNCQVTVLPVASTDGDDDGVSDGQDASSGTDPDSGNTSGAYAKIWIEAEDGDINSPMEIGDNTEASEGSYVWVPEKAGKNGFAEYTFEVQTAGEYLIWGRVISNDKASDSFYVAVDGGSDTIWHTKQDGNETWVWDVVSTRNANDVRDTSNPLAYHLDAGVHSLSIKQREDGTKIDRILITNDTTYVPIGMGEKAASETQKIWIEAEEGDIALPMQIETDTNASAGGYVTAPSGADSGGFAQFTFDIQEAGDYVIWGRVIANDSASDSFYVSIDGGTDITWHTKQGGQETWTWDVVSERNYDSVRDASNPLTFYLTMGTHTLTIKQRENGTKIDRILITGDMTYTPERMGEQSAQVSQKIWIEAESGVLYAPMQTDSDAQASNGSYVWVPKGAGSEGYAECTFEIQKAGEYVIWGRVVSNDDASDSFNVSINGGSDITWHTKQGGQETWVWDVVSIRNYSDIRDTSNPFVVNFEAGIHTLTIKQREHGTKIDRILITNDMKYMPEG